MKLYLLGLLLMVSGCQVAPVKPIDPVIKSLAATKPLVIAHRGAPGYLPEHTLESATLAFAQGADFIEQDLVVTKDSKIVVLHDIHLETVTNVEQMFPSRKRGDGRYYALDFTLAELKTLRVHERQDGKAKQVFPNRYQGNGHFTIATFEEHIELIQQLNRQFNKTIGFYPEIKSPAWHRQQGVDISKLVVAELRKHNLDDPNKAIYVQCFDFEETQRLRNELKLKAKLVQLLAENDWQESPSDYDLLKTPAGLKAIAKVAQGVGPWIPQLVDLKTLQPTGLVKQAHLAGLQVHPYTFRQDALPKGLNTQQTLQLLFTKIKVNGLFTDFTDTVVEHLAE
ncbi:glycerophosphodiester phosphodiesterase [uncultured Paraglaciecola sp.]|uniref:glycerophosphodiester phosphodiesterase n=1 Tax=uncultured Paraglaciecola sp. TaxID=1765024 RepID=UPI0026330F14|nr:glycerophosphodiester phosphodiesterase [uncultured Paraglaciecola sp.]